MLAHILSIKDESVEHDRNTTANRKGQELDRQISDNSQHAVSVMRAPYSETSLELVEAVLVGKDDWQSLKQQV